MVGPPLGWTSTATASLQEPVYLFPQVSFSGPIKSIPILCQTLLTKSASSSINPSILVVLIMSCQSKPSDSSISPGQLQPHTRHQTCAWRNQKNSAACLKADHKHKLPTYSPLRRLRSHSKLRGQPFSPIWGILHAQTLSSVPFSHCNAHLYLPQLVLQVRLLCSQRLIHIIIVEFVWLILSGTDRFCACN